MLIISMLAGNKMKITILTSNELKIALILIFPANKKYYYQGADDHPEIPLHKRKMILILTK